MFNSNIKRILITGGAGFIGGEVIRLLLKKTNLRIFNLDKIGYASDLTGINKQISSLGRNFDDRHVLLKADLTSFEQTENSIKEANPDLILHLAAESHVDRSIDNPSLFVENNIIGTFNLLEASLKFYLNLSDERKSIFKFHHVSTDEVFGALGIDGKFNELTRYDPRSPYSASKASSDHLVSSWNHTYSFPTVITNCSNNYGPWQFPEKLIPNVILKAFYNEEIPLYGDGKNIRDWLYVEDHAEAILLIAANGRIGEKYCIGGNSERNNKEVVTAICEIMDEIKFNDKPHKNLIKYVEDRPGHDFRYAIDFKKINEEFGWKPRFNFNESLRKTVYWYLENLEWCEEIKNKANYDGSRIGLKH